MDKRKCGGESLPFLFILNYLSLEEVLDLAYDLHQRRGANLIQ